VAAGAALGVLRAYSSRRDASLCRVPRPAGRPGRRVFAL